MKYVLTQYMRLVSNQKVFSIPWTVLLFGATVGEAILWEFAEAAPRPQLRLPALGVTPSPPRRPKLAWRAHNASPGRLYP